MARRVPGASTPPESGAADEGPAGRNRRPRRLLLFLALAGVAAVAAFLLVPRPRPPVEIDFGGPVAGWPHYGGDVGGTRSSPLTQITPENVGALEVAWTYRSGDVSHGDLYPSRSSFQAT
ncbi:MAG: hypothetical protein PVI57_23150, partial [Gemmatimonadota bacterium]